MGFSVFDSIELQEVRGFNDDGLFIVVHENIICMYLCVCITTFTHTHISASLELYSFFILFLFSICFGY